MSTTRKYMKILLLLAIVFLSLNSISFAGTTTYRYDDLDRLYEVIYSDGRAIRYIYDEIGNLHEKQVLTPDMLFFNIETSVIGGGAISPAGNGLVNYGTNQIFTISPYWGWYIQDVKVDDFTVGAVNNYTFQGVLANHTILSTFFTLEGDVNGDDKVDVIDAMLAQQIAQSLIQPTSGQLSRGDVFPRLNGSANPDGRITMDDVELILDKIAGYHWPGDITCTNPVVSCPSGYVFNPGQGRCINGGLQAKCILTCGYSPVTITATSEGGGVITPSGQQTVAYGATRNFAIVPFSGYRIIDVKVDGVSQGPISRYSFPYVTGNQTITASFSNTYAITATAGGGGTISPSSMPVRTGTSQTFTITPSTGYHIKDVVVDGVSKGPINSYTFSNVTATHSISASFEINTYVITVIQGIGEITPESASVTHGSSQTFNISHTSRYLTVAVKVDGVSQGALSSYTLSNVTAPHTIEATFSLLPCSNPPARIDGPTPVYFNTLQAAYNAAANGATIQTQGQVFTENFIANKDITVTIDGGYTCQYAATPSDKTMLQGVQNISNGVVTLKNFKVLN